MSKINTTAIATAVNAFCVEGDRNEAALVDIVHQLKAAVKGITSKQELRDALIVPVAAFYKVTTKSGQRGVTFAVKCEVGQKRVNRMMKEILGAPEKAEIEIDFKDADVKAMQAMLKRLEVYADMEVDGKKVGAAKALALLVAEAKDRI
jgi:hypothetical protein